MSGILGYFWVVILYDWAWIVGCVYLFFIVHFRFFRLLSHLLVIVLSQSDFYSLFLISSISSISSFFLSFPFFLNCFCVSLLYRAMTPFLVGEQLIFCSFQLGLSWSPPRYETILNFRVYFGTYVLGSSHCNGHSQYVPVIHTLVYSVAPCRASPVPFRVEFRRRRQN